MVISLKRSFLYNISILVVYLVPDLKQCNLSNKTLSAPGIEPRHLEFTSTPQTLNNGLIGHLKTSKLNVLFVY